MSLLLQALRRAEQSKQQKEAAGEIEPFLPQQAPALAEQPLPMIEQPFPVIVIEDTPSEASSGETDSIADSRTLQDKAPLAELAFETAAPAHIPENHPAEPEPTATPTLPPLYSAPATETPAASAPSKPAVAPTPKVEIKLEPTGTEAARTLLSAPRAKKTSPTLPWLVLGGCVLLGGVAAWFWWQLNGIQTVAAPVALTPISDASAPAMASADMPASSPEQLAPQLNSTAVLATTKKPEAPPAAKSIQPKKPAPLPRPQHGDTIPHTETGTPIAVTRQPVIERRVVESAMTVELEAAWHAYQKGDLGTAESKYQSSLKQEPRNRDAMLGLAAIAVRRGNKAEAIKWYKGLLTLNPQDEDAKMGLISIDGDALSERNETHLRQQSDHPESPRLLGQYYAARQRWHEAQEQNFIAYSRDPGNADLAFNLAVSLDHLNQARLAAEYYRKALALGNGSFDRAAAARRAQEIEAARP